MLWWTDELRIGIDSIDNQHKGIFDKANDIFDLGVEANIGEVKKIFAFLMNYATNHFLEEEQVMMERGYEDFINHREQHNYFVEELYKMYQNINKNGVSEEILINLKVLIIEWLAKHINKDDKKFISLVQDNK